MFIAIRLADAHIITVCMILSVEVILHLKSCFNIIQRKKRVATGDTNAGSVSMEIQHDILKLVASEISEVLVAVQYAIGLALAYFGPNGHLQGNILNQ